MVKQHKWFDVNDWVPGDDEIVYVLMEHASTIPNTDMPMVIKAACLNDVWHWVHNDQVGTALYAWQPVGWRYIDG